MLGIEGEGVAGPIRLIRTYLRVFMLVVLGVWIGFVVGYEKLSVLFVGWSVTFVR